MAHLDLHLTRPEQIGYILVGRNSYTAFYSCHICTLLIMRNIFENCVEFVLEIVDKYKQTQ